VLYYLIACEPSRRECSLGTVAAIPGPRLIGGLCSPPGSSSTADRQVMPIYIDADACPVKEEVYRVARRYSIKVFVVANAPIRVPNEEIIELVVARGGFDAADDRIVESVVAGDIVITTDIPLADRCLRSGAKVLGPKGVEFTEDAIGEALATRALLDMLRQSGAYGGGPAPFAKADRSRFLAKLDELIHAVRRGKRR
jgi:uncharacterized protein YaiI (UPF0178 family)